MCKLMIIPSIQNNANVMALVKAIMPSMSKYNKDGLGYIAMGQDRQVYGERWLYNGEAFKIRARLSPMDRELMRDYGKILNIEEKYNNFGQIDENLSNVKSLVLHTRMATSSKGLLNCHPFILDGNYLVHNGVISNIRQGDLVQSTCDSEKILNLYTHYNVKDNPELIDNVAHDLSGYYACAVMNESGYIDVFKSSSAKLYAAMVESIGLVFVTELTDLLLACRKVKLKVLGTYSTKSNNLVRIDIESGRVLGNHTFDEFTTVNTSYGNWSTRDYLKEDLKEDSGFKEGQDFNEDEGFYSREFEKELDTSFKKKATMKLLTGKK
jgi:hypothetical protein